MKEIYFKKDELLNLEFSLNREILRANMSNAYACTTLAGCNTRKYHGLLIVPQEKIDGENHVLLSSLDETIVAKEQEFHLSIHRYKDGTYYPKGHKYLESYYLKDLPITTYVIGDIRLTKQIQIQEKRDRLLIKYTLVNSNTDICLKLKPLLAFRSVHKLCKKNSQANTTYKTIDNGVAYKLYDNYTPLYIQFSKKVDYVHNPDWYYDFRYDQELERGYDYLEDLLAMGEFSVNLSEGESFYLACGIEQGNPFLLSRDFQRETANRFSINTMEDVLKRAARMFFCRKGFDINLIAGFPWFGRWGRDTFISLPGLSYALEDYRLIINVTDTMLKDYKEGFFPNIGHGDNCAYNSVDTPLWFFWCLQQYCAFTGQREFVYSRYGKVMKEIINTFEQGTFNARMESNYLLYQEQEGKALTWMDAVIDNKPVTQRKGFAVEINALWYNAVMFMYSLAQEFCDDSFVSKWQDYVSVFASSFKSTFWSKDMGYLADCVYQNEQDWSVRPNMIFACSLEYSPISLKIRQLILEKVKDELFTPRGLATLSPKDKNYHRFYQGDQNQRDLAYHNGPAWPWLLGAYCEGYLRVYGKEAVDYVNKIYKGFENILCDYCVGSIAEIYESEPPFTPKGSISQAWSVAEVTRLRYLIDKYSKQE